ncbi:hypothetical protein BC490_03435 [Vibrio parahaemolyticus]|uniref:hypothetical protein n=1 Tax=Vibrio parahaemolyticus TaxID=670 RepID=UPI00038E7247|nr:hypothetical protein [Vibrio parahaemolyticus]RFD48284.1 hypothetical protein H328_012865 [Vibrio parahaemolyticus 3355]EGQ8082178.1 hypothetical protein [Vibrio parahaemolyticus]EGR0986609.1 hypothetical protein [Vibrio parahaemolyticus]EGR1369694.1 hypothetical protein [Vibrio parahaemolyticus]EIK4807631.1 hypothetical protein [Vibrio parahaemolyticus]
MSKGAEEVKPTADQIAAAQVAAKEWNRYQDVFVPVENEYAHITQTMGDEANYERIAGAANTTANSATSSAVNQTQKQLSASGFNPSSGKASSATSDIISGSNADEVQTAAQGQHNVTERFTGNLQNVVAMGRGQATQATAGLNDIAAASAHKANQAAINEANAVSIPAAVVGAGTSLLTGTKEGKELLSSAKQGLSDYFKPNTYKNMQSNDSFSPMGGASSYGLS